MRTAFLTFLAFLSFGVSSTWAQPDRPVPALKKGVKQLFADSVGILSKQGVTRVVHPAKKLDHPVLTAEMPWEVRTKDGVTDKRLNIYGTVLRDEKTGDFRMWYADPGSVLYATSTDGLHWQRPILNISGATNETDLHLHSASIIEDKFEKDPKKRYKAVGNASLGVDDARLQRLKDKFEMVDWYRDKTHRLYYSAYSGDGLRWTVEPEPILLGCDTITLSQDPATGEYLAFHKRQGDPRVVGIRHVFVSVSPDMKHWSEPQPAVVADEVDNRATRKLKGGTHSEYLQPLRLPLRQPMAWVGHPLPPGGTAVRIVWQ